MADTSPTGHAIQPKVGIVSKYITVSHETLLKIREHLNKGSILSLKDFLQDEYLLYFSRIERNGCVFEYRDPERVVMFALRWL